MKAIQRFKENTVQSFFPIFPNKLPSMIYRAESFVFLSPIFLLQQFSYVLHMGIFRHLFVGLIVVVAEASILN